MNGLAFDRASVRTVDANGHLHIAVSNISKATVNPYQGSEIPNADKLGLDPRRVYYLLRDPDELEKAAPTFNNLSILSEHIPVSSESMPQELIIGSTGTDCTFVAPYLQASAVVWPQDAIDDIITEDKREWSCAYRYEAVMTPGIYEGLRYDGKMVNIIGNHVALVVEGRAGPDVVVGDEMPMSLKSRRALMLNGALRAFIVPKLAQDAKVDFSGALGGVTAKNLEKQKDKLAAKVVSLVTSKLAADEAVDVDDVIKVIAAVQGEEPAAGEDDDLDANDPVDVTDPKTAVDADDDTLAKLMAWLEGKLSSEDMAECSKMLAGDEDTDDAMDEENDDEDKVSKPAMDAALAKVRIDTIREMNEIADAKALVKPIIGEVTVAMDSAAAVYRLALDASGVDHKGIRDVKALRALVTLIKKPGDGGNVVAFDSAKLDRAESSFTKMFPNARRA
jgi:uncharacterized protein